MKRYRLIKYFIWDIEGPGVVWMYQIESSYLGIIWAVEATGLSSEKQADTFYKTVLKPGKWVKYYDNH